MKELTIIIGFCALSAILYGAYSLDQNEKSPKVFQAWQQLNPQSELSYENWKILKDANLLPGQPHQVVSMPIFIHK